MWQANAIKLVSNVKKYRNITVKHKTIHNIFTDRSSTTKILATADTTASHWMHGRVFKPARTSGRPQTERRWVDTCLGRCVTRTQHTTTERQVSVTNGVVEVGQIWWSSGNLHKIQSPVSHASLISRHYFATVTYHLVNRLWTWDCNGNKTTGPWHCSMPAAALKNVDSGKQPKLIRQFETRSQAVARIADRTASQHLRGHVTS